METKDLIPIVAVGGALGLIVYLASKNKTSADNVTMPYGWGSFQNSDNPVTPVPSNPPATQPPRNFIEPWNGSPWNGDYQNYIRFGGNWEAYQNWLHGQTVTSVPIQTPRNDTIGMVPMVPKAAAPFRFNGSAVKTVIKPVMGKKSI